MKSDEDRCADALQLARMYIRKKAPYVTKTLYGLVPYTAEGLGTLGVSDRLVLCIDPKWFITLTLPQQGACLMHEISHVIRGQHRMAAMPDRDLANIAFDLPINHDLREGGWTLPHGLYPENFGLPAGLTGEQYYELLDKGRAGNTTLSKKLSEPGRGVGQGRCGSCAGAVVDTSLEEKTDAAIGRTKVEVGQIRNATAQDIRAYQGSGRGKVPETLMQWLPDENPNHRIVRWRDKMSYVLRRATGRVISGRTDYSYRRVARRSFILGTIKPGMVSRQPTIGFVEDTSGSMGQSQLLEGRCQAVDVMSQLGIERAWWISADAAVSRAAQMLRLRDIRRLPVVGGGGTDFRPAIAHAQTLNPKPDVLIYLTDGDGTAPEQAPPGMEIVFCIVPSYYNKSPATWGQTIILADLAA